MSSEEGLLPPPYTDLLASQVDVESVATMDPAPTPPVSQDRLYSSSLFNLSSQLDMAPRLRIRQELGAAQMDQMVSEDTPAPEKIRVIWGTNIVLTETIEAIRAFLRDFTLAHQGGMVRSSADVLPFYPSRLQVLSETGEGVLELDGSHFLTLPQTIPVHGQLLRYPQEIIPLLDMAVNELYAELFPTTHTETIIIQVRPFNIGRPVNLRLLDPADIDQLVTVKGLIIRTSNLIPDMRVAYFACSRCGQGQTVENVRGRITEPANCSRPECQAANALALIHNRSLFSDRQVVRMQETPDEMPEGQTPHSVTLCLYDRLVDSVRPGDRVEVTGIYRSSPVRIQARMRKLRSLFRTFVDVVHVKTIQLVEREQTQGTGDLVEISREFGAYDRLARSIAPNIFGLVDVKRGLLLQLCGGVPKVLEKAGGGRVRGDINILLAGDPGVSKSQLLQAVHSLAPRGIVASGKGSSAVGLTAYVTRDPDSGQLVLESGALVLSDGGCCCIDEFDKMAVGTRAVLHEAMEQQTVSVAKAGIVTTLNARASILAVANPVGSKYNPAWSIIDNLNLPPTLLSRFDLICLLLDNIDAEADARLAKHIVHLYTPDAHESAGPAGLVDGTTLRRYIAHARTIRPVLSEAAANTLVDAYVSMRKVNGSSGRRTVSATCRQLESLVRLSEARARVRLANTVEVEDVHEAVRLVQDAIHQYAIDPLTGRIDMDLVTTGRSAALRDRLADLRAAVLDILTTEPVEFGALLALMNARSSIPVQERWLRDVLEELGEEEAIVVTGNLRRSTAVQVRRLV